MMRPRRALAAVAAALAIAAHAGAHDPYDEGYRRGFLDGWREGQWVPGPQAGSPPRGARVPAILVNQADYGDGYSDCDATAYVGALANGKPFAAIPVGSALCGGDPAPGRAKTLRVLFFCGAMERELTAPERQVLQLRCD